MRILIIQPDYYPKQTPRVFRWKALAEHWAAKGWEVDILCASHSKCPSEEYIQGVKVHRTGQGSMLDLVNNIFNEEIRRKEVQKGELLPKEIMGGIWSALGTFFHWVWKNIYWPDGSCIWIGPAKKKALQLFKKSGYDAVISVSLPFSSHLVGLTVKRCSPQTKWVVDIGDPFSTLEEFPKNNLLLYKKYNYTAEEKVLNQADAISLTTHGAEVDYQTKFPCQAGKIHVIPPLYVISKSEHEVLSPLIQDRINIGYFGSFYSGIRQPEPLLGLFSQLFSYEPELKNLIRIHIFGYLEPEFYNIFQEHGYLYGCLILHGQIDKKEVNQIMEECDFLVNIGNTTTSQLPSKSVDYMMSGKPIINVCQIHEDTFRLFLKDYPIIINLLSESGQFSKMQIEELLDFVRLQRGKRVAVDWLKRKVAEFCVDEIAKQFENLMVGTD